MINISAGSLDHKYINVFIVLLRARSLGHLYCRTLLMSDRQFSSNYTRRLGMRRRLINEFSLYVRGWSVKAFQVILPFFDRFISCYLNLFCLSLVRKFKARGAYLCFSKLKIFPKLMVEIGLFDAKY